MWADNACIQFHLAVASWQDHIEFVLSEDHGYVQSLYFSRQKFVSSTQVVVARYRDLQIGGQELLITGMTDQGLQTP